MAVFTTALLKQFICPRANHFFRNQLRVGCGIGRRFHLNFLCHGFENPPFLGFMGERWLVLPLVIGSLMGATERASVTGDTWTCDLGWKSLSRRSNPAHALGDEAT